jgi:hypothetical protein
MRGDSTTYPEGLMATNVPSLSQNVLQYDYLDSAGLYFGKKINFSPNSTI